MVVGLKLANEVALDQDAQVNPYKPEAVTQHLVLGVTLGGTGNHGVHAQ